MQSISHVFVSQMTLAFVGEKWELPFALKP